jgi:hypothetical protein
VFAAWMRDDQDDPTHEFQFEMNFLLPPDHARSQILAGKLFFEEGKPVRRTALVFLSPLAVSQPGLMWVESRLRRSGDNEWLSQKYPIILEPTQTTQQQPSQTNVSPPSP